MRQTEPNDLKHHQPLYLEGFRNGETMLELSQGTIGGSARELARDTSPIELWTRLPNIP